VEGRGVVHRNAHDLRAVVADNDFQYWHTEWELFTYDLNYRVHHRGSRPVAVAHNMLNRTNGYA